MIEAVPVEDPIATEIDAGTVDDVEEELRVTVTALLLGTAFNVTVTVVAAPPTNVEGDRLTDTTVNGVTARAAVLDVLFDVAVMVVEVEVVTTKCVTVNVAVVAPAGTVTEAATVAAEVDELLRVTTLPLGPAGLLRVTVPVIVTLQPPTTVEDDKARLDTVAAVIVSVEVTDALPIVAVMVALAFADTATVVTVKVPVLAPAAIVTDAGTVALVLLDLSDTTNPPVGAMLLIVTEPVDVDPPSTDVGETVTLLTVGAVIAKEAVDELVP